MKVQFVDKDNITIIKETHLFDIEIQALRIMGKKDENNYIDINEYLEYEELLEKGYTIRIFDEK